MLKVSERTIWRWIHGGKLAARRFGRQYRIRGADIEKLAEPYRDPAED